MSVSQNESRGRRVLLAVAAVLIGVVIASVAVTLFVTANPGALAIATASPADSSIVATDLTPVASATSPLEQVLATATTPATEAATLPAADTATTAATAAIATEPAATVQPATSGPETLPTGSPTGVITASDALQDGGVSPQDTLARLESVQIPERDPGVLNARLHAESLTPTVTAPTPVARTYAVGDTAEFWVGDIANHGYYTVTADLVALTDHAYWWVDQSYDVDRAGIRSSANTFESDIYPTDEQNFGAAPVTGADNDQHINVLFTSLNGGTGGYFSASDMYPTSVNPYSNARKMIYINGDPTTSSVLGTLTHELQHMIHFGRHQQHDIWINEGMSELAMKLAGYSPGGVSVAFMQDPDIQLNQWAEPPSAAIPHYGAAFLFMDYLYQQFGGAPFIDAMLQAPGTGIDSVNNALQLLGRSERFSDVFTDWALANWLDGSGIGGRYEYPNSKVQVAPITTLSELGTPYSGTLHEQATNYIQVTPPGNASDLQVNFSGESTVPLISTQPHSGATMWWSNRADVSDATLTRDFDLSGLQGKVSLQYWLWYDLEPDYDFGYVEASADGGQTWTILQGSSTVENSVSGTSFGPGYNGTSGGGIASWVQEQVDLSAYAGQHVQIRFEYVTDEAFNAQGIAIDDISIPELGYSDDAEGGAGGWQAAGFARVGATIPQSYAVAVIAYPQSGAPQVALMPLDAQNKGTLTVSTAGGQAAQMVVMVAALAPYTLQTTDYDLTIAQAP